MSDPLAPVIRNLHEEGRLRAWSLLMTVFGDSVQHRGGRIATARLRVLLERVGVSSGTLRTALSRLGQDGWVSSEREGRSSSYTLNGAALEAVEGASQTIYAAPRATPVRDWVMRLGGETGLQIAPGVFLAPADAPMPPGVRAAVTGPLTEVAPDLAESVLGPDNLGARAALRADLAALQGLELTPLESAAARTLLIHRWRRLVLRHPELPPGLPGEGGAPDLRTEVACLYRALTPGAEAWLSSDADGLDPMPAPDAAAARRFG
ncbi:hypothetical protein E0K89_004680 [Aquicoccus sp. SCR17]|nr:hypothetical protein [Carideicomes alvinocaridis]